MKKFRLLPLIVLIIVIAAGCSGQNDQKEASDYYADLIFDTTRVHTIEITMSEEDRADQLANPKDKTKYEADVVIDGEELKDVAFSTKGNSSLYMTVDAGKEKYSYGINFGKFKSDQTFHGLDKINLQNNFADATSMKEYMAYWLFRRMGADAPFVSFAWLTVNGEDQGLYSIIEAEENSFLERTADGKGTLYKPEDEAMGLSDEEMKRIMDGGNAAHDSGGGTSLVYKDDNETSYPDIFENAETEDDPETRARVIRSLKALSEKADLDQYLDTEEIIKYFAVHNFLVAYDSYTGLMLHNYILYENNGKLAMLPWDYDLAFGSFPMDAILNSEVDSTLVINTGIDSPLGDIEGEARPMWNWIPSDENYLKEYHGMLSELVDIIDAGEFQQEADRVSELIAPYIEKDPVAFFDQNEFRKAYATLIRFTELRAESVQKQVTGQLATRSEMQAEEDKVNASGISIRDMGYIPGLQ